MGCISTGLGWKGKTSGVNQAPSAVSVRKEKVRAETKFLRSPAAVGLEVSRCFFFHPIKRIPKNGVSVRHAQNAKRSYVSHSQARPKKRRGKGVVPPSPRRNKISKETSRPQKRGCHFRTKNGRMARKGPYRGKKKIANASGSLKKLCRDR